MAGFLKQLMVLVVLASCSVSEEISEDAFDANEELEVSDQKMEVTLQDTISSEESVGQDPELDKRSPGGPPPYLVKCRSAFVECKNEAGGDESQILHCYPKFSECFAKNRPDIEPQGECEAKLHRCLRDSGNNKIQRQICYSNYCSCHLGNCPGHPSYCRAEKAKCLKNGGRSLQKRGVCFNKYRKCMGVIID